MEAEQYADDEVKELVSKLRGFGCTAKLLSVVGCLFTAFSIYLLAFGSDILDFDPSNNDDVLLLIKWIFMGVCLTLFGVPFIGRNRGGQADGEHAHYVISWTVVNIVAYFFLAFLATHPATFLRVEPTTCSLPASQSNNSVSSTECTTFKIIDVFRFPVMGFGISFGVYLTNLSAAPIRRDGEMGLFSYFTSGRIFTVAYAVSAVLMVVGPIASWSFSETFPLVRYIPSLEAHLALVANPWKLTTYLAPRKEILSRGLLLSAKVIMYAGTVLILASTARSGFRDWQRGPRIDAGIALQIATWASAALHQSITPVCYEQEFGLPTMPQPPYRDRRFTILDIVLVMACLGTVVMLKNTSIVLTGNKKLQQKRQTVASAM